MQTLFNPAPVDGLHWKAVHAHHELRHSELLYVQQRKPLPTIYQAAASTTIDQQREMLQMLCNQKPGSTATLGLTQPEKARSADGHSPIGRYSNYIAASCLCTARFKWPILRQQQTPRRLRNGMVEAWGCAMGTPEKRGLCHQTEVNGPGVVVVWSCLHLQTNWFGPHQASRTLKLYGARATSSSVKS